MDLAAALGSPALSVPRAMGETPAGGSLGSPQLDFGDYEAGQTQDAGTESASEETLPKADMAEDTQGEVPKRAETVAEDGEGKEDKMEGNGIEQQLGGGEKSRAETQTGGQEVSHVDPDAKDNEEVDTDEREPRDETEALSQNPDERRDSVDQGPAQQEEAEEAVPVEDEGHHESFLIRHRCESCGVERYTALILPSNGMDFELPR
ncbi:hypothetical protein AAFF_G00440110 [Aldrovandia affinis]|uniref:Uncharacterized protein n=1 Tax=Aldrovandia affinis TaxID=143900 RepID=A0AAD7S7L7_9TELE|nr:hypothetical protein AAFF_G00440110 [Aldrovandia affinis]